MSTTHWDRTDSFEETSVSGSNISELIAAASAYVNSPEATWRIEHDSVVFSFPMGTSMVGREVS